MEGRHLARGLSALVALMGGALVLSASAFAATYAPNRLGDHTPNGCTHSDCTLREAIDKANGHPGPDALVLRGGKTYNLSQLNIAGQEDEANATGDLDVLDSLVIRSSNRKPATVDANGIDRVFEVGPSSPVSATFQRIVIRGGKANPGAGQSGYGGGIDAEQGGVLELIRSKVVGNRATYGGGIDASEGSLRLIRSVIAKNRAYEGYGGGVYDDRFGGVISAEVVFLSRAKIVGNSASNGVGGIETYNDTKIIKSTIANNRAQTQFVGGLSHGDGVLRVTGSTISGNATPQWGGGIANQGSAILVNDTITKNHAGGEGGGVYTHGVGSTSLNAVTIARNSAGNVGGGVYVGNSATMNVKNSLIGLNTAPAFGADCNAEGDFVSGGHNLVANPDTQECVLSLTGPGDITNVNPRIAQLANNGGPTKTIALRRHSKAINHAGSDAPKRDQRGVKRHDPDIGAFERR
jgi:hypothetical protein